MENNMNGSPFMFFFLYLDESRFVLCKSFNKNFFYTTKELKLDRTFNLE